jgi:prepilin-type N-terminal cleavage/methylation domain-containing protein
MSAHRDARRHGFTLLEVLFVIVVVGIVGLVIIPGFLSSSRGYNSERNSSTSLKTLASAEADFRANDRDWNHINDFWTGDVKGLYTLTSAAVRGAQANSTLDPSIKLIELSVASADADGNLFAAGGENVPLAAFAVSSAKAGYWYAALNSDLSSGKEYRQDSGGELPMGNCHNASTFGFVAFPDSPAAGKYVYILNQNNTIYRAAPPLRPRGNASVPPGLGSVPTGCLDWPADATLKSAWTKND